MNIITRAQWGAKHSAGFRPAPDPASETWLHHSATIAPDLAPPFDDDHAAIRMIERIGQERFGGGVPYTFCVTPVGLVFEGTGPGREGAHTRGHNTKGRGICWVGNYELNHPTEQMIDATAGLLRAGQAAGWWKHAVLNGGHRDVVATACPGRHAYAVISEVNQRATAAPPAHNPEDDMAWDLERTPLKAGHKLGDQPDASWPAVEDTIATPGPAGGWRGRILPWLVFGFGGGFVQEAWWGVSDGTQRPVAVHLVRPGAGQWFPAFWPPPQWEAPVNARFLVVRYAAPAGGSVSFECQR